MKKHLALILSALLILGLSFNASAVTLNPGDSMDVIQTDDSWTELDFTGFSFPFYGTTYTSMMFSNSNGNITFGVGSSDFTPTAAEFLSGPPRIAGLWQDLNPSTGGTINVALSGDGTTFTATFTGVWVFGVSDSPNTFSMVLSNDGTITYNYELIDPNLGTASTSGWIIGVTPGGNAPATDVGSFNPGDSYSMSGGGAWYANYLGSENAPTHLEGGSISFTSEPPVPVPALSPFSLLLLGGLLFGFAAFTIRQPRKIAR